MAESVQLAQRTIIIIMIILLLIKSILHENTRPSHSHYSLPGCHVFSCDVQTSVFTVSVSCNNRDPDFLRIF